WRHRLHPLCPPVHEPIHYRPALPGYIPYPTVASEKTSSPNRNQRRGQLSDRLLSTLVRVSSSCRTHFAPSSSPSSRNTFANCRSGGAANSGGRSSHLSRASAWVGPPEMPP